MKGASAGQIVKFLRGPGAPALAEWLSHRRWFAAKTRGIGSVTVVDWAPLRPSPPLLLVLIDVDDDRYYVPVSAMAQRPADARSVIAALEDWTLVDAHADPEFGRLLLCGVGSGIALDASAGRFVFRRLDPWPVSAAELAGLVPRLLEGEQSNSSLLFDHALILKSFRRPVAGVNPDLEVTRFLASRTSFAHAARPAGWIEHVPSAGAGAATVSVLQHFVENQGDGWEYMLARLAALCESIERRGGGSDAANASGELGTLAADLLESIQTLGAVTGELHAALASEPSAPDFCPEPITGSDTARWGDGILRDFERLHADVSAALPRLSPEARSTLLALDRSRDHIVAVAGKLSLLADGGSHKIRCHGDYHLGQVLKTADAFLVIDFEGEPARPLDERRRKQAALRDVAGMLRSFDYAVHAVVRQRAAAGRPSCGSWLEQWEATARRHFLDGYLEAVSRAPVRLAPTQPDDFDAVCAAFELEKACYELAYELNNRPDWIAIPLAGISRILAPG